MESETAESETADKGDYCILFIYLFILNLGHQWFFSLEGEEERGRDRREEERGRETSM